MRSPAIAIAWEFRRRHRWGLAAIGGYLLALLVLKLVLVQPGRVVRLGDIEAALVVVVPLTATFTYFLAVFSYGLSGDLTARQSMYPARLFTLPVSTWALAGWPVVYGTLAMVTLWMATRLLAVWPAEFDVPVIWPALLAATLLAWTQALMWMPYGLPGLRAVVAVLWLAAIDAVVMLALHFRASEPVMAAILLPQQPLAYLEARLAVARARRGEVPDWRGALARLARMTSARSSSPVKFRSAARAQAWFEWRQHGRSLPAWVAILLPFELSLLLVAGGTWVMVFVILASVCVTPPLMAAVVAAQVRTPNAGGREGGGLAPFTATRPITSAGLIAAKLEMATWSTIAAWLLVLVAIPVALVLTGTWPVVVDRLGRLSAAIGAPRVVALVLLATGGCVLWTWKQLVQSLYIGLTGSAWLARLSMLVTLMILVLIGPLADWVYRHKRVLGALWSALPLILAALVLVKLAAAGWVGVRLYQRRVIPDRVLVVGAAAWCVAVLGLYGAITWYFSTAYYAFGLFAILAIPVARLSAATLAIAGLRHR